MCVGTFRLGRCNFHKSFGGPPAWFPSITTSKLVSGNCLRNFKAIYLFSEFFSFVNLHSVALPCDLLFTIQFRSSFRFLCINHLHLE